VKAAIGYINENTERSFMKITSARVNRFMVFSLAASMCFAASASTPAAARAGHDQADAMQLIAAVRQQDVGAVRRMAGNGADVNAGVHGDGTALIVAAKRGDLAMVNVLLELGAGVNKSVPDDGNPLIAASAAGSRDVMARLLAAGASVNAVVPDDETALISAVRNDRLAAVELLVEHGADVNLGVVANGTEWRSPLNQARSESIRKYLSGHGAVVGHPG
jgi:ankyrin repeat protein